MTDAVLRVLIADDEPVARRRLALLCDKLSDVVVAGEAADGATTLDRVRELSPDVVLLDVSMPERDGVAVAAILSRSHRPPAVVFCTASPDHAIQAFDVSATDYLLKPVSQERLARALARVRANLEAPPAKQPVTSQDHLWVPHRGTMRRVEIAGIRRIDAEGDFVRIVTDAGQYLLHETLTRLGDRLDPRTFVRLRRSTIVHQNEVRGVRHVGLGAWEALLADGNSVRIGPTYWKAVKHRLGASGMRPD